MSSAQESAKTDRRIYRGLPLTADLLPAPEAQRRQLEYIPSPPPWRTFGLSAQQWLDDAQAPWEAEDKNGKGAAASDAEISDPRSLGFVASPEAVELVNAALCLRRPILIEGKPGSGKTSLAYAVAQELGLPGPYRWSIVSRTTLKEGLYAYDAIGRLQAASLLRQEAGDSGTVKAPEVGDYLRLGPMGMAFYQSKPRRPAVLLIDEIDKSDIDMPNDLLHIFEEGFFEIPELTRLKTQSEAVLPYRDRREDSSEKVSIPGGCIQCSEFPLVFMTSNEAREFPPAFLRRCLRLNLKQPKTVDGFYEILEKRFDPERLTGVDDRAKSLIGDFLERMNKKDETLATDQLLNAVYLLLQGDDLTQEGRKFLRDTLFKSL